MWEARKNLEAATSGILSAMPLNGCVLQQG